MENKTIQDIKEAIGIPLSFGVYKGKARNFAVYTYQDLTGSSSNNKQNITEDNVLITFYVKDNFIEFKNDVMCALKEKEFIVRDTTYSDYDTTRELYTFALEMRRN